MSALSTAKKLLANQASDLYMEHRWDLELTEYPEHFANLAELIQQIDQYQSMGHIITDMETGKLEVLGYFVDDDEYVLEFLTQVRNSIY